MSNRSSKAVSCGSENHNLIGTALSESKRERGREEGRGRGREGGRRERGRKKERRKGEEGIESGEQKSQNIFVVALIYKN